MRERKHTLFHSSDVSKSYDTTFIRREGGEGNGVLKTYSMPKSTLGEAVSIASLVMLPSSLSLRSTSHRGSRWPKHCLGHFRQVLQPMSYRWWRRTPCPCPRSCSYPCPAPIAADHCGGASCFPQFMAFCITGNVSVHSVYSRNKENGSWVVQYVHMFVHN